jgi:hypothetical protein
MKKNSRGIGVIICLVTAAVTVMAAADEADVVFNLNTVQVYRINFESDNFWQQLLDNAETETPLECTVQWHDMTLTGCGIRIKGNSSQRVNSEKKPFKLEFDEFNAGQRLHGLEHVNFNNCYKDPSFIREVLAYELFSNVAPVPRANYAHLYLNGEDWGIYVQVEEVEEPWLATHFGDDSGNLYKGDPAGSLTIRPSMEQYKSDYELKTNTEEDDWSDLTNFIYVLNTTTGNNLPEKMDTMLDIYRFLRIYAVNNFLASLDSYWGTGHNYYFYNDPAYNRFSYIVWDVNEAFGNFQYQMTANQMLRLSYDYVYDTNRRPLATRILAQDVYNDLYTALYNELLEQYLTTNIITRMKELHDFIRPYVLADPKKLYSDNYFEINLEQHVVVDRITAIALQDFPTARRTFLQNQLDALVSDSPVRINELMAWNTSAYTNESGDTPDWIELYNTGEEEIELEEYYLSDNSTNLTCWKFPDEAVIAPHGHLLITAAGNSTNGVLCANFKLNKEGERVFLSKEEGNTITVVDGIYFDAQTANVSYGRETSGYVFWCRHAEPTPGAENVAAGNFAPEAENLLISPISPRSGEPVMVYVTLTDDTMISTAWCYAETDGSTKAYPLALMVDNVYTGMITGHPEGTEVEYWITATDNEGKTVRLPASGSESYHVTEQAHNLVINEFMAINDTAYEDEYGEYNDWIELYNYGTTDIELTGMSLSDDGDTPMKWTFPETTITAGTFLVLWADGDEEQGMYHLPFKLSGAGEEIGLYDRSDAGTAEIHTVVFGQQAADISFGMFPDGYGNWTAMEKPTPGTYNTIPEPGTGSFFWIGIVIGFKLFHQDT